MASVHLARMDGPGGFQKWVAIKRIHPHLVEDDQFVDMFLDEARIAAGINHANVAQVFDLGKDDNTYWIAMEYLHGEPLREIIRRAEEKRMSVAPELAARICADAAEGLHAAHELRGKNGQLLGLVHRDVTPHNLFVTYDGYTKVVDFGIAKVADRLASTRAGTLKGKLAYMSPEQVRGSDVDRTTDIFALGVVLWELTTNQRLFRMDTDLDTLEKVQACNVPPPSSIIRGYPPALEAVVMRALAKRKQDRFQTAREFSRALQGFLMQVGSFVGPEEVAQFVRHVFVDRIAKREAHLAWAAEVTSTVNVDQLRAQQGGSGGGGGVTDDLSLLDDDDDDRNRGRTAPSKSASQPIANRQPEVKASEERSQSSQMAASSLMDDDEDVPTTVATRDHLEKMSGGPLPTAASRAPMPAAGAKLTTPMPAAGGRDERTAALPGGGFPGNNEPDDLNATIALPANAKLPDPGPPKQNYGGQQQAGYGGYPAPQAQGFNGQPGNPQQGYGGYPQQQQQQQGGYPQAQQQQQGYGGPPPSNPNAQYGQRGGQSQIETAMSLPRPDPAALWMAQQEAAGQGHNQQKRNTGVMVLVVALVMLSVVGIGLLVYFKLKTPQGTPPVASVSTETTAAPSAAPVPVPVPAPAPSPTETVAAAPTETAPAPVPGPPGAPATAKTPTTTPTATPTAAPTAAAAAGGGDPGFLTIVCNPFCDDVLDNGRSLGPSPIVHLSVKPGSHRVTLKKGSMNKVISVIVVSGQVTAQRVSMK